MTFKKGIYHSFIAKNSYLSCLYFVYFSVVLGEITHLKA